MSIMRNHPDLHKALIERWNDLKLKNVDIIRDAEELKEHGGPIMSNSAFSRYRKGTPGQIPNGAISDEDIIWLATRWGIYVSVNVGVASVVEEEKAKKVRFKILKYDEKKNLEILKKVYGKKGK